MEKYKEKIQVARLEIDQANTRTEANEKRLRQLNEQLAHRESESVSYLSKLSKLEDTMQHTDAEVGQAKQRMLNNDAFEGQTNALMRKAKMLEDHLNDVNAQIADAQAKLSKVQEKAQHFAQQSEKMETERERFDQLAEEMAQKYVSAKRELEDTLKSLETL